MSSYLVDETVLRQVLDALDNKYVVCSGAWQYQRGKALEALRTILSKPPSEPVAEIQCSSLHGGHKPFFTIVPLNTNVQLGEQLYRKDM